MIDGGQLLSRIAIQMAQKSTIQTYRSLDKNNLQSTGAPVEGERSGPT
jgi:hypothetical protein